VSTHGRPSDRQRGGYRPQPWRARRLSPVQLPEHRCPDSNLHRTVPDLHGEPGKRTSSHQAGTTAQSQQAWAVNPRHRRRTATPDQPSQPHLGQREPRSPTMRPPEPVATFARRPPGRRARARSLHRPRPAPQPRGCRRRTKTGPEPRQQPLLEHRVLHGPPPPNRSGARRRPATTSKPQCSTTAIGSVPRDVLAHHRPSRDVAIRLNVSRSRWASDSACAGLDGSRPAGLLDVRERSKAQQE